MADLTQVDAIVKTFLRDAHMMRCVDSLRRHYPDVRVVVVDDGRMTAEKDAYYGCLRQLNHIVEDRSLPFDSGFGAKSNLAMALCTRPYVLCCNDDFLFDGDRDGVRRMVDLLEAMPEFGLACGTWCGRDYQGWLRRTKGRVEELPFPKHPVVEERYDRCGPHLYREVDLCAVYCVMRRTVFTDTGVRVDGRYKIGGEHGDWFMDVRDAGWKVAFTPFADISQIDDAPTSREYYDMRLRQDWKRVYREKHGPHTYKYFSGDEEVFA
jgi:GT2 family glycosyltransferase